MLSNFKYDPDPGATIPKYRQFANALAEYLAGVEYIPGTKLPSDRELAAMTGLSVVTMSKALNLLARRGIVARKVGSGTYIRPPNSGGGKRIAVVCHQKISNDGSFVTSLWTELHRQAPEYGADFLMMQTAPEDYHKVFSAYDLAGMIVLSAENEFMPLIQKLNDSGMNIVQVGMYHEDYPEISFGTDHAAAAEEAVNILHAAGHSRIAFIPRVNDNQLHCGTKARMRGYQLGMYKNGLPVHPDWIMFYRFHQMGNIQDYIHAFDRENFPTAFIFEQTQLIVPLEHILRMIDFRVPQDVSMLLFDHSIISDQIVPVSVYTHDTSEMAKKILDHLFKIKIHDGMPLTAHLYAPDNIVKNKQLLPKHNNPKKKKGKKDEKI